MKTNHTVVSQTLNLIVKTGSRNRVRITTGANRFTNKIAPGTRVKVGLDLGTMTVAITPDPKGNYKVEKDGAVRFPAHKFNLPSEDVVISADVMSGRVDTI